MTWWTYLLIYLVGFIGTAIVEAARHGRGDLWAAVFWPLWLLVEVLQGLARVGEAIGLGLRGLWHAALRRWARR